jgi:SNF2 family DNA or RNA helicase
MISACVYKKGLNTVEQSQQRQPHLSYSSSNSLSSLKLSQPQQQHQESNLYANHTTLIVVTLNLMANWKDEVEKFFAPYVKALFYHQDSLTKYEYANITVTDFKNQDIVFVTTDTVRMAYKKFDGV